MEQELNYFKDKIFEISKVPNDALDKSNSYDLSNARYMQKVNKIHNDILGHTTKCLYQLIYQSCKAGALVNTCSSIKKFKKCAKKLGLNNYQKTVQAIKLLSKANKSGNKSEILVAKENLIMTYYGYKFSLNF